MFQRQTLLAAHTFLSPKKDITKLNVNGFFNLWKTVYPFKTFSHTLRQRDNACRQFSSHLTVLASCKKKPRKIVLNKPAGDLSPQHLTLSLQCEQGLWEWNTQTDDTWVSLSSTTRVYWDRGRKRLFWWVCFEAIRYPILCAGAHITSSTALHHTFHAFPKSTLSSLRKERAWEIDGCLLMHVKE